MNRRIVHRRDTLNCTQPTVCSMHTNRRCFMPPEGIDGYKILASMARSIPMANTQMLAVDMCMSVKGSQSLFCQMTWNGNPPIITKRFVYMRIHMIASGAGGEVTSSTGESLSYGFTHSFVFVLSR